MITGRNIELITSEFGERSGKFISKYHKGVDLRSRTDDFKEQLKIYLPERSQLLRIGEQAKWGWYYVFKPLESGYEELKYIHMSLNPCLQIGETYDIGKHVGYTIVTDYMKSKDIAEHLHFETWKNGNAINPVIYFNMLGVKYDFKN